MRPTVSLESRQPWITSGHLASQRSTSLSNSNAAQLLRCPSVHRTTGTGQSYLTPKYFSSAKETPFQLRPPILPTLPHSPSAPAWWRACTAEWWLQICVHLVGERALSSLHSKPKGNSPVADNSKFPVRVSQKSKCCEALQMQLFMLPTTCWAHCYFVLKNKGSGFLTCCGD